MLTLLLCAIAFQDLDRGICPEDYRAREADLIGRVRSADLDPITKEIGELRALKAPDLMRLFRVDAHLKNLEMECYVRDRREPADYTVDNVEAQFLLAKSWFELFEMYQALGVEAFQRRGENAWASNLAILGSIRSHLKKVDREKMPEARTYILRSAAMEGTAKLARLKRNKALVEIQTDLLKLADEVVPTDAEIGGSEHAFTTCLNRALAEGVDHPAKEAVELARLFGLREFSTSEVLPKPEGFDAAAEGLQSDSIETRDAASAVIQKMGRAAERPLRKLRWSANAEVRSRAEGLLARFVPPEHEARWWEAVDSLVADSGQVLYSELTDLLAGICKRDPSAIHRPTIVKYLLKRLENHVDQVDVHYLLRKISGKRFEIDENKWEEWLKSE